VFLNISARSVHNTRIERLWYDITNGFGRKWKSFFMDLEAHHGLDPTRTAHIWLLHHLFLRSVDQDAQEWAQAWNSHKLQIKGQRERSPRDMFFFGMLQEGPRGMTAIAPADDDEIEDYSSYGVDWEVNNDETMMAHYWRTTHRTGRTRILLHQSLLQVTFLKFFVTLLIAFSPMGNSTTALP
jgi:hypothetical protein